MVGIHQRLLDLAGGATPPMMVVEKVVFSSLRVGARSEHHLRRRLSLVMKSLLLNLLVKQLFVGSRLLEPANRGILQSAAACAVFFLQEVRR